MTSDITPSLGEHKICPHSGLTITTKPSWQNIQTGDNYSMSYGIIGDKILLTVPKGDVRTVEINQAMEARASVLKDHFGTLDPIIAEIRDFSAVHGVPSHSTRSLFWKSIVNQKKQQGLFVINMGWILRTVFLTALRLHPAPFPLEINSSYQIAITEALKLVRNKEPQGITHSSTETDSVKITHQIIENSIIFSQGNGQLVKEDIPKLLQDYEKLLCSKELTNSPIFRIADYTQATKGNWKGRILLIQGLNKLHKKHDKTPTAMAIYGLNPTLHTAMRLASKILNYPIFIANNKNEAFTYIRKKQQGESPQRQGEEKQQDVEDILHFISTIIWDDSDKITQPNLTNTHLAPIQEALLVVRGDVHNLLEEAKEQTKEIARKNTLLKAEIKRRKTIEEKLTTAIKEAEAANQAKGNFLATMSHEIRTPMNGILGMIHLLEKTQLDAEQHKYLDISNESATSLLQLINDILDFSKVDQGQLQMEITPFSLTDLCETCCALFSKDIQDKALTLSCHIDPKIKQHVIGDPGKLRQILINLLNNAIKFTPSGSITLRATLHKHSPVLTTIKFSITDTGIGIAKEKTESIFDTFSQADSSTTRQYGGTGLGLSICRKICEFMEGKLEVQSTLNEGTTFSFTLPFGLGEILPENNITQQEHHQTTHIEQNIRILVVEDEPVNQFFVEALLDQFGYQHDHANNGKQALEAIKNTQYHIILMDCQMPIMDGYEATTQIRSMQFTQGNPIIIALTAHAMEGDRERCLACGMDEYIAKPIIPSILLEVIEKFTPASKSPNNE